MHAVGIKRVFWTTANGDWEGRKVQDLVEALEGVGGTSQGHDNDSKSDKPKEGIELFVTKHEVLMLRRVMAANQERAPDNVCGRSRRGKT